MPENLCSQFFTNLSSSAAGLILLQCLAGVYCLRLILNVVGDILEALKRPVLKTILVQCVQLATSIGKYAKEAVYLGPFTERTRFGLLALAVPAVFLTALYAGIWGGLFMLTSLINHDWEIINQIVLVVISLLYFGYTVALGKNGMEIIRKLRNHWMWNTNRTWREHGILLGVATTYPILGFILGLVF